MTSEDISAFEPHLGIKTDEKRVKISQISQIQATAVADSFRFMANVYLCFRDSIIEQTLGKTEVLGIFSRLNHFLTPKIGSG
jgi:hypothetical protein